MGTNSFTKLLKRFKISVERNEGISLISLIMIIVIMSVMAGVFTSLIGTWKISIPLGIDSTKAFNLAETAAMFAVQDAKYKFHSGNFDKSRTVISSSKEEASYSFSKDGEDDATEYYTITATGKAKRRGNTVAKRVIKVKIEISDGSGSSSSISAGIHTDGSIEGTGGSGTHFDMSNPATDANVAYGRVADTPTSGSEEGIVYRSTPTLDSYLFEVLAKAQDKEDETHYYSGDTTPDNNYPCGSGGSDNTGYDGDDDDDDDDGNS